MTQYTRKSSTSWKEGVDGVHVEEYDSDIITPYHMNPYDTVHSAHVTIEACVFYNDEEVETVMEDEKVSREEAINSLVMSKVPTDGYDVKWRDILVKLPVAA